MEKPEKSGKPEKRERHAAVERRRRERTASLLEELDLLVGCGDGAKEKNSILEKAVVFISASIEGNQNYPALALFSLDGALLDWNFAFGDLIGQAPCLGLSPLATNSKNNARCLPAWRIVDPMELCQAVDQFRNRGARSLADPITHVFQVPVRSTMWLVPQNQSQPYIKLLVFPHTAQEAILDCDERVQLPPIKRQRHDDRYFQTSHQDNPTPSVCSQNSLDPTSWNGEEQAKRCILPSSCATAMVDLVPSATHVPVGLS